MLFIKYFGQLASSFPKYEAYLRFISRQTKPDLFNVTERNLKTLTSEFNLIKIDDSCLNRLKQVLARPNQEFLRINIETGGCSGLSYVFDIERDDRIQPGLDLVFERDNYRVVVNKEILPFIKGSTIEYHESLIKSSFQVVNPIAETKCSCGSSFSIDLSKINQLSKKEQEKEKHN